VQEAEKWQSWLGKSSAEVHQVSGSCHHIASPPCGQEWSGSSDTAAALASVLQLFLSLSSLVRLVLFSSSSAVSKQSIAALFPPGFHPSLLALLTRILLSHIAAFRSSAASSLPSPPRLVGFSTAVHSRVSSSVLTHLNQPCIFLSLQLQHPQTRRGEPAEEELVTCELKKETLKTMLSGLEKIQEQLSSMQ
jgi:hypothetical protein